jgi:hypothetical protein
LDPLVRILGLNVVLAPLLSVTVTLAALPVHLIVTVPVESFAVTLKTS